MITDLLSHRGGDEVKGGLNPRRSSQPLSGLVRHLLGLVQQEELPLKPTQTHLSNTSLFSVQTGKLKPTVSC